LVNVIGGVGLGVQHPQAGTQEPEEQAEARLEAEARMNPVWDRELLSADQAAAAVAAATRVRNTIFIDLGVDVGEVNRSSSCPDEGKEEERGGLGQ
jgi:hypothetical protein